MSTETQCVRCGRPMADQAYACSSCSARAGRQLDEIASLTAAARAVAHRQSNRGEGGGSNKPGSSPPIDFGTSERLDEIQNDLLGWARHVAETRGIGLTVTTTGADPIALIARWLTPQLEWLRHQPEAGEALESIGAAAHRLVAIINGPTPGRYAGPCGNVLEGGQECGEDVTSRPGSNLATCKACGAGYDVDEQQEWMRGQIEDHLARPVEIAGVLLRLGNPIGYSTIAAYAAKGQLVPHGHDEKGRALYRIGDVLDLRMGMKKPRRERELPRGAANPVGG